jgi:hypothetical protein
VRRDALIVLFFRGWASAFTTWKGLVVALLLNAALALSLAQPVVSALHAVLDRSTFGERLLHGEVVTFANDFTRNHPEVLGSTSSWEALLSGGEVKQGFFGSTGAAGAAVFTGIAMALLSALLAGGFAGRFGADSERASLTLFGADVARYGLPSLFLGAFSFAGIVTAYRWVYVATGDFYVPADLRYEWESVALTLFRLLLFLTVAGFLRILVLYARAAMGLRQSVNALYALGWSAGFVLRRPVRVLLLEVFFGAAGLLPLLAWVAWAPSWDGKDAASLVLLVAGQQLVVLWRIAARTAHLGAAVAFLRRAAEKQASASAPASASAVLVADPSEG